MKKRIISIILCFLIGITFLPGAFSASAFNPSLNSEVIGFLEAVGVLDIDDEFIQEESMSVTKGEFARLLICLVGMRNSSADSAFEQVYNDVKSSSAHAIYINAATQLGFFGENVPGYFYPNEKAKTDWALKAVMRAMGYSHNLNYYTLDLTDNVYMGKYLNRDSALRILYNALEIPIITVEGYTSDGSFIGVKGEETLLSRYFDITAKEGIILADFYSSVQDGRTRKGYIRIGTEEYRAEDFDTRNLVGLNVRCYIRENDIENEVVFIKKEKNLEITIPSKNLSYSYENSSYTTVEGRKKATYKIDYQALISYNGCPLFDKNLMVPTAGDVVLIDNNNDRVIDVCKIREFRNIIVQANNLLDGIIYDKTEKTRNLDLESYKNINVYSEKGQLTTIDKIIPENILTVYESPDKKNVDIYISTLGVSQVVDTIYEGDYSTIIVTGGIEYPISPDCMVDESIIKVGQRYYLYINHWNEICYASADWEYDTFWLLEAERESYGRKKPVSVKGMLATGEVTIYELNEKIRWITYGNTEKITDDQALSRLNSNSGSTNRQLLKIGINKYGKINEIVLPYNVETRAQLLGMSEDYPLIKMNYIINEWPEYAKNSSRPTVSQYYGTFQQWLHFSSTCKDFCVNTNETKKDADDDDLYVRNTSFVSGYYEEYSKFNIYMQSKDSIAADYVIKNIEDVSGDSNGYYMTGYLLNKIYYRLNEETEEYDCTLICTARNGSVTEIPLKDESIISVEQLKKAGSSLHTNKTGLSSGDIIAVQTNVEGKGEKVRLLYDYKNKFDCRNGGNYSGSHTESVTGKVVRKSANLAEIEIMSEDENNGLVLVCNLSNDVLEYNAEEKTGRKVDKENVYIDDTVVAYYKNGGRFMTVVYRDR